MYIYICHAIQFSVLVQPLFVAAAPAWTPVLWPGCCGWSSSCQVSCSCHSHVLLVIILVHVLLDHV